MRQRLNALKIASRPKTFQLEESAFFLAAQAADRTRENARRYDETASGRSFAFNLRFPGQYFDVETGTHHNYFRDYDPGIGRYIESDPIGLKAGLNTYSYVGSRPLTYIDPYGLVAVPMPMPPPGIGKPSSIKIPGFRWPSWMSKSDLDECKDDCDAKKDRDDADCEWRYKMPGRVDRDGYRGCLQISSDKWVDCYRDCNRKCK